MACARRASLRHRASWSLPSGPHAGDRCCRSRDARQARTWTRARFLGVRPAVSCAAWRAGAVPWAPSSGVPGCGRPRDGASSDACASGHRLGAWGRSLSPSLSPWERPPPWVRWRRRPRRLQRGRCLGRPAVWQARARSLARLQVQGRPSPSPRRLRVSPAVLRSCRHCSYSSYVSCQDMGLRCPQAVFKMLPKGEVTQWRDASAYLHRFFVKPDQRRG